MCTAITYQTKDHYFGRNLDLEYAYNTAVTVTPRNYPLHFRKMGTIHSHYALIGMATVVDDYPLYFEATNKRDSVWQALTSRALLPTTPKIPERTM